MQIIRFASTVIIYFDPRRAKGKSQLTSVNYKQ
jgi:hypothetical protein